MAANAPRVPKAGRIIVRVFCERLFPSVRCSDIRLWSQDRNLGLPSRATSTYHTASNYWTRDPSDAG